MEISLQEQSYSTETMCLQTDDNGNDDRLINITRPQIFCGHIKKTLLYLQKGRATSGVWTDQQTKEMQAG